MKRATDMNTTELEALESTLKATATKHSPVCTCSTCQRYAEIGIELLERQRTEDEIDTDRANELRWI